jgi:hypothetical protein
MADGDVARQHMQHFLTSFHENRRYSVVTCALQAIFSSSQLFLVLWTAAPLNQARWSGEGSGVRRSNWMAAYVAVAFGKVDNAPQDLASNVLYVGCIWRQMQGAKVRRL